MAPRRGEFKTTKYESERESIIDTAAHLFARNGYAATGVQELGEAVGLARGALYYYIGSKDALLTAIHDRVLDPLLAEARRIRALEVSAPARLVLMSELLLGLIVDYRDHVWVFLHEHHQLKGDGLRTFRAKRAEYEGLVSGLIAEAVESGAFQVSDLRLATLSWLNLHNYTYHWVSGEKDVTVERLVRAYNQVVLKGFAATPFPFETIYTEVNTARDLLRQLS
jgi:AcrR family transcriptional regulator